MSVTLQNGEKFISVREFFSTKFGIPEVELTTDWNIIHYETLLKYTKKLHLKRKHQEELNWWLEMKEIRGRREENLNAKDS